MVDMGNVIMQTRCRRTWLAVVAALVSLIWMVAPAPQVTAATGSISLYVTDGPAGTMNSVTGSGFTPDASYTLRLATTVIGTGVVSTSGEVAVDFLIPTLPRGQYAVTVTTASDTSNTEYFILTPKIAVDTTTGRPGSQVHITFSGFQAYSSVTVLFDGTSMGSVMTNASGSFASATFTIPASSAGAHTITGKDVVGASPGVTYNTLQPEISLSQKSSHVGDQISVIGTGFVPNTSISIMFDSTLIGSVLAGASGAFPGVPVTIPHSAAGAHAISAKDAIGASGGIAFNIPGAGDFFKPGFRPGL